jgi:hypothetical protein
MQGRPFVDAAKRQTFVRHHASGVHRDAFP